MVAISPTQQERRAEHMTAALAAIVKARATGDAATVQRLLGVYEATAETLRLYGERQAAEQALNEAHRRYADAAFNSRSGHATTAARADQLVRDGVAVFPVRLLDGERNPAALREGAALFEALAAACRGDGAA